MRLLAAVIALAIGAAHLQAQGTAGFPHAKHTRLFPTCTGCHGGIAAGNASRTWPPVSLCAACHDGVIKPVVTWSAPVAKGPGMLVFSHSAHAAKAKDATCESCHAVDATGAWMNVARPAPERCASCHAHGERAHLADANTCTTCHRPLTAATAMTDARIAALPTPPSHTRAGFANTHGDAARANATNCATCHARESCLRCHVDGATSAPIRALASDARVARVVAGKPAVYPAPADHRGAQFGVLHATSARSDPARCATCHARASCATCHTGTGAADVLRRLPDAREATAPGVQLRQRTPDGAPAAFAAPVATAGWQPQSHGADTTRHAVRVHAAGFARTHGAPASSGDLQCASCHAQRFCSTCHVGERAGRRYHAANFVSTHAPSAYSRDLECGSCHSREAFCRDCHRQSGIAAKAGVRSTVFHNAQPLWLLLHGGAARQDLTSCTTCHQQTYCMQCHSQLGARINPHGPGFDAARMSSRNPQLCLVCHLKNPLGP